MVAGKINRRDAVRGLIGYAVPKSDKSYALGKQTAVSIARLRGWHLMERHVLVDGQPVLGGLFDLALYCFHNAKAQIECGSGP